MNTSLPPPPPVPPPPSLPPQMFILPKCCGCFDLRIGSIISCFIWAAFSMFLAVMSFKDQNIFFTYLTKTKAPTIIFGVINLILSLIATVGMVILVVNSRNRVKSLSHAIWVCISLVLISTFANVVVYLKDPDNYIINQCITDSRDKLQKSLTEQVNATIDNSIDYYHCSRLREDELKFGIISFILMFSFYVYWALCLYRYRYAPTTLGGPNDFDMFPEPFDLQPAMTALPPPPPNFVPNDRATIILTNQRPKKLSLKRN